MVQHLARLPSGISGLDRILDGGFAEGASYIIQGRPGAGKTILSNQIAFWHARSGLKVLYVTLLSESHDRLFQALSTLSFYDSQQLGREIAYVSAFQILRDDGLGAVVKMLRKEIRRHGATLLIFDGLLNARDRASSDLDVKTFVAEVQGQAAFIGCTVLFLTSTRLDDASPEYTMVDGVIDLTDELFGVRTVRRLQVRKSRGIRAIGGLHQFEITDDGIVVYPRIEAVLAQASRFDGMVPDERIHTGCADLDTITGGGLPRGSVTLLAGPTGSGKTLLGLQFLGCASPDEPALHFGFFETPARLSAKAALLGIDLTETATGRVDMIWNPLGENLLDKLGYQLLDHVAARGVKRVFIDGLGGFARASAHPSRLVEYLSTLTNQLRASGVTTLATWELREITSSELKVPAPEISAILDNLILMRTIEENHALDHLISVQKMRDSDFDPATHRLIFTGKGLKVGERLGPDARVGAHRQGKSA